MAYVVFDLEYNNMQGLLDDIKEYVPASQKADRYLYPNEIIQIGAVKLDENFNITEEFNRYVKNYFYKCLNPVISEMTGIKTEDIESGVSYREAFDDFVKFCENEIIMSWGTSDVFELIRNCHMHKMKVTIVGKKYLDLQDFVGKRDFENRTPSLKAVLTEYGVENDDNKLHDGLYDSICTAGVLKEAYKRHGKLTELKNTKIIFSSDSIYITNIKVRDIPDKEVTMKCPLCEGHISYDISMNNEHGKVKSFYHCKDCSSNFLEEISVKENMTGNRKYFKKIKKITKQHYDMIVRGKQIKRANSF